MRIVFDLDDTICTHKDRKFAEAKPVVETIERMKKLKQDGWEIIIYSARGQNSCHGVLSLIENRNRAQVEEWLRRYDVPYDSLLFGKPLADFYIDDKGMSLDSFLAEDCEALKGYSGAFVYKIGKRVVKQSTDAKQQGEWYKVADGLGIAVPQVYSIVLNSINMEFIDGIPANEIKINSKILYKIVSLVIGFSLKKNGYHMDIKTLEKRVTEHLAEEKIEFKRLYDFLDFNEAQYEKCSSFCHGDLSLSNIIIKDDKLFCIDPIVKENLNSYLMDFAKIRFSLDGGEQFLHKDCKHKYNKALLAYDDILEENGIKKLVIALEATYWLRLLKYTVDENTKKEIIINAKRLEDLL